MSIQSLDIMGLRGFAEKQRLDMALPSGKFGSGITILVGPNNGGKSTIIEAFAAISREDRKTNYGPSFPKGQRNQKAAERVYFRITYPSGGYTEIKTIEEGGALTRSRVSPEATSNDSDHAFVLPAKRFFTPFFEMFPSYMHRSTYANQGEFCYGQRPVAHLVVTQRRSAGAPYALHRQRCAVHAVCHTSLTTT